MRSKNGLCLCGVILALNSAGQLAPSIEWQACLGGSGAEEARDIVTTPDGGYFAVGWTRSSDVMVTGYNAGTDLWVAKIDAGGGLEWQRALGGSYDDDGHAAIRTSDGGYLAVATASSADGDVGMNNGYDDVWVVKFDGTGVIQWSRVLGGTGYDRAGGVAEMNGGGYVVSGSTSSSDGDIADNHGGFDCWVVKLDPGGATLWENTYGGTQDDHAYAVAGTNDGGCIVTGSSSSSDGDVAVNQGMEDLLVLKLDGLGTLEWESTLGGSFADFGTDAKQVDGGGYVVCGSTQSTNGDVVGQHGMWDYWLLKFDVMGGYSWQLTMGGSDDEMARGVDISADGGFFVTGRSESNNGDVAVAHGGLDSWTVKVSGTGSLLWQRPTGSTSKEWSNAVTATADGGCAIAGFGGGVLNGDVTCGLGASDFWIVKFEGAGFHGLPEPTAGELSVMVDPSGRTLQVSSAFNLTGTSLVLSDATGRLLLHERVSGAETRLDLGPLAAGHYTLSSFSEQGRNSVSFVLP